MCAQSVSGSSLLSGYDEDDARETNGRSRREFDQVDAVLYGEEAPKRSSIKKISEEWSSRPRFRICGRHCPISQQSNLTGLEQSGQASSSYFDSSGGQLRMSSFNFIDGNARQQTQALVDNLASGRSSVDSTEGSGLPTNSDLDDDLDEADATNHYTGERFGDDALDQFDTDDDDDDAGSDGHSSSNGSARERIKHAQPPIKCLKDSIINKLASALLRQFLTDQQVSLQRYARQMCAKNSIVLRRKPRPSSLPPHSMSHNRLSLPTGSSTQVSFQHYQPNMTPLPFRSTPEPNGKLTSLLRVTPLRVSNASSTATAPASPRKSQMPPSAMMERTSTSLTNDKRQQQPPSQISLVGTAVGNLPIQLRYSTPQTSHTPTRPAGASWRYRSATTLTSNAQNVEPTTRLPPITIERLFGSELSINARANTLNSSNADTGPPATRAVSGVSTMSNASASASVKLRAPGNMSKLQRAARPMTITSTKELSHAMSTSPTRAMLATSISSTAFRASAVARTPHPHSQQQKRALLTTNPPPPPPTSGAMKVPVTRIC